MTVGDEFMAPFHRAARGELTDFVLVIEGSIPNEKLSGNGYWAAFGTDPKTGQPITIPEWIDRLAPKALAVVAAGTCATYGGIHAMEGNPTGCMGLADYLGWNWKSKAGLPIVNVPGCPVQPDNFMETLLYLLRQLAGLAPMIPLDEARPSQVAVRARPCTRAATAPATTSRATSPPNTVRPNASSRSAAGVRSSMQRPQARLDGRHRRLPQCRWHLHRLHHAGLPRQVHAVHGRAAGRDLVVESDQALWLAHSRSPSADPGDPQSRSRSGVTRAPL